MSKSFKTIAEFSVQGSKFKVFKTFRAQFDGGFVL